LNRAERCRRLRRPAQINPATGHDPQSNAAIQWGRPMYQPSNIQFDEVFSVLPQLSGFHGVGSINAQLAIGSGVEFVSQRVGGV